ncbi:MAG: transporter related [Frankiales bacterium]|nr:transporter related [Frankiales bacterium]
MPIPALVAHDLIKSYDARIVLDGVDFVAAPGRRIGCVGENGVGKSTFLRLLAGVEAPDSGTITRPAEVAYLAQEPSFGDSVSVRDAIAAALDPLHRGATEVERLSAALATDPGATAAYNAALEWAQSHDVWDADRRADLALKRLGLAELDDGRGIDSLSGGQRSRLAMATIITSRPDCVLLDEPTNHLDDDAALLLEEFLLSLPGVVVITSHDRVFLDRVATDIVDLDEAGAASAGIRSRGAVRYGGNFSTYLHEKEAARRRWEQTYRDQQQELTALRRATAVGTSAIAHNRGPTDPDKFVHKFKGANVERTHARRIHSAERRLDRAERAQVRRPPAQLRLTTPLGATPEPSLPAIAIRDLQVVGRVSVPYLQVRGGERLLITGANGSGKSSLLAVIAGQVRPDRGTVDVRARRIGVLSQDSRFSDPQRTAREVFAREAVGHDELGDLGLLPPRDLNKPVAELSAGQRRRLALAIVIARQPDLLLLDEPTNHISLALASELGDAFKTAPGTILVASHDRWLRQHWTGDRLDMDHPAQQVGAESNPCQIRLRTSCKD